MQRSSGRVSIGRLSTLAVVVSLIATVTVSCTTSPSTGGPPPNPTQQFCEFWDRVEDAPPAEDNAVLVKDEVVALAEDTTVSGSECTDPGAEVELDGAVLAEGEEVPSEQGNPSSAPTAAVTGDEISAGQPVLENLRIQALSAEISRYGITVRGNVAVRLSGVTSTIGFVGTLANLHNWSITLSSSALSIPGITTAPVVFNGSLASVNGVRSLSLSAFASSAKVGDVTVTGALINLHASPATGVSASVAGAIKIGPSTASGTVDVVFDRAGALVSAKADISAHLVGTQAGGKKVDLAGKVKFDGNANEMSVSFSGSGIIGDLVVNEASGSLELATNRATFVGVVDVVGADGSTVRMNASIVWDGLTAFVPYIDLPAVGQILGTLINGQVFKAEGSITVEVLGGQFRTVVTGDFLIGTLKANGSAILETSGTSVTLELDAALQDAGFDATITGAVIITDGHVETAVLDAAVDGQVSLGDATLNGANLHIESFNGGPFDMSFEGQLVVEGQAQVNAAVDASFGPNGTLLSLDGDVNGSVQLQTWGILNFTGTVVASPEQVTLTGSGAISTNNLPLGIVFNGTITSKLTEPTWQLNGTGRFRIASINVATARLSLSHTAGMAATRVGFYFSILGIPTYFEGDFFLKPEGGCTKVDITNGGILVRLLLKAALEPSLGCPVNI